MTMMLAREVFFSAVAGVFGVLGVNVELGESSGIAIFGGMRDVGVDGFEDDDVFRKVGILELPFVAFEDIPFAARRIFVLEFGSERVWPGRGAPRDTGLRDGLTVREPAREPIREPTRDPCLDAVLDDVIENVDSRRYLHVSVVVGGRLSRRASKSGPQDFSKALRAS